MVGATSIHITRRYLASLLMEGERSLSAIEILMLQTCQFIKKLKRR